MSSLTHCDFVCSFQFQSGICLFVLLFLVSFIWELSFWFSISYTLTKVQKLSQKNSVCAEYEKINKWTKEKKKISAENSVYNIEIKTNRVSKKDRENEAKRNEEKIVLHKVKTERMMSNAIVRCEVACWACFIEFKRVKRYDESISFNKIMVCINRNVPWNLRAFFLNAMLLEILLINLWIAFWWLNFVVVSIRNRRLNVNFLNAFYFFLVCNTFTCQCVYLAECMCDSGMCFIANEYCVFFMFVQTRCCYSYCSCCCSFLLRSEMRHVVHIFFFYKSSMYPIRNIRMYAHTLP